MLLRAVVDSRRPRHRPLSGASCVLAAIYCCGREGCCLKVACEKVNSTLSKGAMRGKWWGLGASGNARAGYPGCFQAPR